MTTIATTQRSPGGVRMSGGMAVVRDTQGSVLFRYQHRAAVLMLVIFGGAAWATFRFIPDGARWVFTGGFGFFALILGLVSMWREELELNLASGLWRQKRGWVWSGMRERRGALAEIPEVELVLDRSSPTWQVRIKAPAWPSEVTVASALKEEKGYAELERWATRLRRDAVDRTGDREVRTAWDALDLPLGRRDAATTSNASMTGDAADYAVEAALADAYASPGRVSEHPPAGSRIVVTSQAGRRRIVLPPIGFNGGVLSMALFGLVFGGVGTLFALVASTIIPNVRLNGEIPTSPVWPMVVMGAAFALIGLFIMVAPAIGARACEWLEDGADALVVGYSGLGFTWGVKRFPKRTIEGVDLSASPTAGSGTKKKRLRDLGQATDDDPRDLRIRTDAKVLRIGRYLSVEERRWLRDRVEAWVRN